ncbi:hypothetical protein EDB85DRAFT_2021476 [Lactarius pseudohatsudake]|nr:hypothetical protein EDB85DRAFT_2021476 [Lactarius pseudohatsudake]
MAAISTLRLVTKSDLTLHPNRGALQQANIMDINSLLNPARESHIMTEATDTDIYQAVMDAIEARENTEKHGGDDVDEDGRLSPVRVPEAIFRATSDVRPLVIT